MFAVGLCVLWVLCGFSKATVRCYTSICDGIINKDYLLSKKCHLFFNVPIGELELLVVEKVVDESEDHTGV